MANKYTTLKDQTVFDAALQEHGNLNKLHQFIRASIDPSKVIPTGTEIAIDKPESVLAEEFKREQIKIGTGKDIITIPPPLESALAKWTKEVVGNDVLDKLGESDLAPQNNYCYDQSEAGIDLQFPHSTGNVDSIDFENTEKFSVFFFIKSGETGVGTHMVMTNRVWSGDFQGWEFDHSQGGAITIDLWTAAAERIRKAFSNGTVGTDILGKTYPSPAINDGNWHPLLITYNGNKDWTGIEIYGFDTTGRRVLISNNTGSNLGTITKTAKSGVDWMLSNIPATTSDDKDHQFQHVQWFNVVLTHKEAIRLCHREEVIRGKIRHYGLEEKIGKDYYNSFQKDTTNRNNAVCTDTGSHGRLNDGVLSMANKKGYTLSASVIIPLDVAAKTRDAAGGLIPPESLGKVSFVGELQVADPFQFKPNPLGWDELVNAGISSAASYTVGGTLFKDNELSPRTLFKNSDDDTFIAYRRKLRHLEDYQDEMCETGQALANLEIPIFIVAMMASQSNTSGSGDVGVYVDSSYLDPIDGAWIPDNGLGFVTQVITNVETFDHGVNELADTAGPNTSMMKDIVDGGYSVYTYQYSVGSTALKDLALNYHHVSVIPGATGIHLYPLGIAGLRGLIDLMEDGGYANKDIEVFLFSDFCCEEARSKDKDEIKTDINEWIAQFRIDFPEFKLRILFRRGHDAWHDPSATETEGYRGATDELVAENTALRKTWNTDAYTTQDADDVHFDIPGQESNGQDAAVQFLTFNL